jgi:hypothetical protein
MDTICLTSVPLAVQEVVQMVTGLLDVLLTGPAVLHLVQMVEILLWHLTSLTGLVTGTAIVLVPLVTPVNLVLHS